MNDERGKNMSVLMEFSMFPLDGDESKSTSVAKVIKMIQESGHIYKLTAMSTIVETSTMQEALALVEKAYCCLETCERIYASVNFDIRQKRKNGIHQKIISVQKKLDAPINV